MHVADAHSGNCLARCQHTVMSRQRITNLLRALKPPALLLLRCLPQLLLLLLLALLRACCSC
jgi:hypothetical protein